MLKCSDQIERAGAHAFDRVGTNNHIEHRLTKPRTPQTNGMIERFNGRIADVLATTRFDSAEHLADTLKRYVQVYNQHIPQQALGHLSPLQAMKNWYQKQPKLFNKRAYNLAGLDTIFGPGTVVPVAAQKVLQELDQRLAPDSATSFQSPASSHWKRRRVAGDYELQGAKDRMGCTHQRLASMDGGMG